MWKNKRSKLDVPIEQNLPFEYKNGFGELLLIQKSCMMYGLIKNYMKINQNYINNQSRI